MPLRHPRVTPSLATGDDRARPLHTTTSTSLANGDDVGVFTTVFRLWSDHAKEACRLCLACDAAPGPDGLDRFGSPTRLYLCTQTVRGRLDVESARFFSPHGLR
jgi:hypothetical protein